MALKTRFTRTRLEIYDWVRGYEDFDFTRPNTFLVYGTRGSGKSALLESLATYHMPQGVLIDLYGARDNEGLAWLRCRGLDKFLLVKDSNVDIKCSHNVVNVEDLTLHEMSKYQAIITVPAFYSSEPHEFKALSKIIEVMYKRIGWKVPWFCLVRESRKFIYSRMAMGDNSALAKAAFVKFISEARHSGIAVGADALRPKSIDCDIREIGDYIFVKSLGNINISDELWYLYSLIQPTSIAKMDVDQFVMASKNRPVGVGDFDYPHFHKEEHENLLTLLDIKTVYGEPPIIDIKKKRGLSWDIHKKILELRTKHNLSLEDTAREMKRLGTPISHTTVSRQEKDHKSGICECV